MMCSFSLVSVPVPGFMDYADDIAGESPINTPWMGLKRLIRPNRSKNAPIQV